MNAPRDPHQAADITQAPANSLDTGLAAAFARPALGLHSVMAKWPDSGPYKLYLAAARLRSNATQHVVYWPGSELLAYC